jgi:hypothetical protein
VVDARDSDKKRRAVEDGRAGDNSEKTVTAYRGIKFFGQPRAQAFLTLDVGVSDEEERKKKGKALHD